MQHKVRIVRAENDVITLKVDGVQCSYLLQRPTPLGLADAALLRTTLDDRLLKSMFSPVTPMRSTLHPWTILAKLFQGVLKKGNGSTTYGFYPNLVSQRKAIADYIEKVGVAANIDKETKGLIILKTDVDKIREGEV